MRLRGKVEERARKSGRERGKDTERHTQKGTNGKGPDALDWFLHGQSLAAGDRGARSTALTRSVQETNIPVLRTSV